MKKLKSLKTLSSAVAIATIAPIAAAGCSDNKTPEPQPTPTTKIAIGTFSWVNTGNYFTNMNNDQIISEFKNNNIAGVGDIPADIYDHVNFNIDRADSEYWNITLKANRDSKVYYGDVFTLLNVRININDFNWHFDTGSYNALMTPEEIINEFKLKNPAGQDLPNDIYDENNVNVNAIGSGAKWNVSLTTNNSIKYGSDITKPIPISNAMVYNNELYTLPESIDINAFCGEGNWTIPLKNTDPLVIPADKHSCLSELFFTTNNDSTTIDDYFLYGSGIKALDLSWLDSIEIIGDSFLHNCYFLTELTLPENNIISKVGTDFLHNCSNLVADIKLTHLTQTAIPKNFITNCPKLNSINLSGSNQINTIDEGFLTGFSGSLDLSGWTQMTTVTRQMFPDKIKSLNLSGWTSVTTISKENFPADLSSLTLSGWTQMTTITRQMFPDNLKVLDLSGWTSMTTLSEDWWPTSVETLNLAGWTGITNLTEDMLGNTIANYNLSGWTGLKTIGDNVLKENNKVYSLNLSGAVNLETIGDDFCFVPQEGVIEWRGPLEYVNLSGFKNIKEIGENFIAGTLFHYGGFYYYDVNLIKSIDLSSWTTTNSVDEDFLQICYYLVTADFSGFTSVSTFGNDLCEWWAEMVWIKLPVFNKGDFAEQMLDRFADNTDFTVTKKGMFVAPKGEGEKWDNYFKHKATNNIVEQGTGYLTYNNENFILADNIDPNVFCKEGSWTVPTKNAGVIVIPESKRNAIRTFALPETITQTEIGNNFLSGCSELAHLDLSALKNVTKIGDNFLQGCSSLSSLDLNGLSNVVSVGNNFLSGLTFISLLDLSPMLKIESIGNNFLSGSSSIIDLTVFNKDPTNITIDSKNFLNTVNKYCFTIHAGLYLNKYKATEPWTEFANNIVE